MAPSGEGSLADTTAANMERGRARRHTMLRRLIEAVRSLVGVESEGRPNRLGYVERCPVCGLALGGHEVAVIGSVSADDAGATDFMSAWEAGEWRRLRDFRPESGAAALWWSLLLRCPETGRYLALLKWDPLELSLNSAIAETRQISEEETEELLPFRDELTWALVLESSDS